MLLISLDSVRRDLLSAYGNRPLHARDQLTTPNIDRLARQGTLFARAYSNTSWTLPSHISILTGVPSLIHGVDLDRQRVDPDLGTMAEILRAHGFRTAGFFSGPYLEPHFGFDRGFDRYEARYGERLLRASLENDLTRAELVRAREAGDPKRIATATRDNRRARTAVDHFSHLDVSSANVSDGVLEELDQAAGSKRPFFIFAHYFDPHYDYVPPAPFDTRFDPDYSGQLDGRGFMAKPAISKPDPARPGARQRVVSDRDLEHIKALYEGDMGFTDQQIGRVLDRLDQLGLAENTLVILTADHGDEFFEHGDIGHRRTLFEEVTRVPLIMRLPDRLPPGQTVRALASTVDILPTVLDLLDLPPQDGLLSASLAPLARGGSDGADRSVLGRLVVTGGMAMSVPGRNGTVKLPSQLILITETWHQGSLKITRQRRWPIPDAPVPASLKEIVEQMGARAFSRERLAWIDLDRHPQEHPADASNDFSDPRARAALKAFHDQYARAVRLRRQARIQDNNELSDALKGLGYVGGGKLDLVHSQFVLPPPGRDLFRGNH